MTGLRRIKSSDALAGKKQAEPTAASFDTSTMNAALEDASAPRAGGLQQADTCTAFVSVIRSYDDAGYYKDGFDYMFFFCADNDQHAERVAGLAWMTHRAYDVDGDIHTVQVDFSDPLIVRTKRNTRLSAGGGWLRYEVHNHEMDDDEETSPARGHGSDDDDDDETYVECEDRYTSVESMQDSEFWVPDEVLRLAGADQSAV